MTVGRLFFKCCSHTGRHVWCLTKSLRNAFLILSEIKQNGNWMFSKKHVLLPLCTIENFAISIYILKYILSEKLISSIAVVHLCLVSSVVPATTLKKWTLSFLILEALWPRLQKNYFGKHFLVAAFGKICFAKSFDIKSQLKY